MARKRTVLITGGAGFIGSAVVRHVINSTDDRVIVLDKLTYSGNLNNLASVVDCERFEFELGDICCRNTLDKLLACYQPDAVLHLAAESHVDRSIDGPAEFIETNIIGTYTLLEASRAYWTGLEPERREAFRFHHVSTDEVFGDLADKTHFPAQDSTNLFLESTPYAPSSPYSASKASSDHLVRAWHRTYGLPVLVTNCSNNYGPYQFPEKIIPLVITNALEGRPLPVYGDGQQIRDWLYVEDHAAALCRVLAEAQAGQTYNIGGDCELRNIELVEAVCEALEELAPDKPEGVSQYRDLITYVEDRPGHDRRYAIDASKIKRELGWSPSETLKSGLRKTVQWYLENKEWSDQIRDGSYRSERLGLAL